MFFDEKMNDYIIERRSSKNEYPYQNHVKKFVKYLEQIDKLDKPKAVHAEDIAACVGFYRSEKKIRKVSTMSLHLSVIKDFYTFLHDKELTPNIFLTEIMNDYDAFLEKLIFDYKIIQGKDPEVFDTDEISALLNDTENSLSKLKERGAFANLSPADKKRYALCLFIKLTLLAPAKKGCFFELKFHNFSNGFSRVLINGVNVEIPNALKRDIRFAVANTPETTQDCFFNAIVPGLSMPDINAYFASFLKNSDFDYGIEEGKTSYSVQKIVDTAINILLLSGANPYILSKVAGIQISEIIKKLKYDIDEVNRQYNSAISNSFYYKDL